MADQPRPGLQPGCFDPFCRASRLFDGGFLLAETFRADAVRGGRVETLLHEFLQSHPLTLVIDPPAPGTDAHEFLQIADMLHDPAG